MFFDSASDAELIRRTLGGERSAFDALVRRHYGAAHAVALAHAVSVADAEDICHDAFVRAARSLAECRTPDRFRSWLCAIVRNHARNEIARARVRRAEPLLETSAPAADDPAREAEMSDLRARLQSALAELPVMQREVVLLHHVEGWTHEAISELLGISAELSRQSLVRARRRLRATLGENTSKEHFNE